MKLRERRERKSYSDAIAILDDDNDVASNAAPDEAGSSGSEFDLETPAAEDAQPDEESDEQEDADDDEEESLPGPDDAAMHVDRPARNRRKPRAAPGGPKGLKARQQGALPAATSHARLRGLRSAGTAAYELSRQGFRPWTTYKRPGKALCLLEPPAPFQQPETQPSNPCTVNINVTRRLNRVFMQNIGPGPLWELLEDCAWWKESVPPPDSIWTQQHLRPTVYPELKTSSKEWSMLNSELVVAIRTSTTR